MDNRRFLFGAATAAHQVEGNNVHSDWWAWERQGAARAQSGRATDHYHRFREDLALAKTLGHTAHRFSIEWSRIEPRQGTWDDEAIAHYREVLQELRRLGLASFVTLHHFTNPVWLADQGGWENPAAAELYGRYVEKVAQALGDVIDFWITINEPMVYAVQAYWRGVWPPQKHSWSGMVRVMRNLAQAHRLGYQIIHKRWPGAQVGAANHQVAYVPEHRLHVDDQLFARLEDWWFNHRWLNLTRGTHDFIGVNYYFPRRHHVTIFPPRLKPMWWEGLRSDVGWPVFADGLTHVLLRLKRYRRPIYVTENGVADARDALRADFIRSHVRAIEAAQAQGVDVRGYLHWSLLDNFEWEKGFGPRFGLVEVDYTTFERTPRPSAWVYKAIIEQRLL